MRSIVFIICGLVLLIKTSCAQKLNNLNSDAEVQNFVKYVRMAVGDTVYKYFALTTGDEILQYKNLQEGENKLQSIRTKNWQKADLNRDGKTDLVVSGFTEIPKSYGKERRFRFLIFLSKNDSFSTIDLLPEFKNFYPSYFQLFDEGNQTLIELISLVPGYHSEFEIKKDTLSVYSEYFFERPNEVVTSIPDTITYFTSSNWAFLPQTTLFITSTGNAFYYKTSGFGQENETKSVAQIDSNNLKIFFGLANRINFQHLKSKYNLLNVFDVGTSHLRIKFKDGSIKQIDDYGHQGTFGLLSIYKWFGYFINNLKWQPIVE